MRDRLILSLVKEIYREFLREALLEVVKRGDNEWDDKMVLMLDALT